MAGVESQAFEARSMESQEEMAQDSWTSPIKPRIQPLTFSFSEAELASDDESSGYDGAENGAAVQQFGVLEDDDHSDSEEEETDITQRIRKLQKQLEEGSSESESESTSEGVMEEGAARVWGIDAPATPALSNELGWAKSEGIAVNLVRSDSDNEASGSEGAANDDEDLRNVWQGLGGDLVQREQRRKELMQFLDTVLHSDGPDNEKVVDVPSNFQALVDGLAKQRKSETPLAWTAARMVGTPEGLQWVRPDSSDSGLVSVSGDASETLSDSASVGTRPLSVNQDPKLQKGFERIEQLDRVLEEKQALAEETARQVYPERYAAQEQKVRSLVAVKLAKRRRRRQAKLRRAMMATGVGSKRVSAGDYVARNMVLGPNARYFTLLPEEEKLVDELLAQSEGEMGDEDASYTTYTSTGFDVEGDEAMQLATVNAKLSALRGQAGYFDSDSFSMDNGSSFLDYSGFGSMSRALPQELGPGSRNDSASVRTVESSKKTSNSTPRNGEGERPTTQRSGVGSETSKASRQGGKQLSSQKRRASSSSAKSVAAPPKFRKSNESDGHSEPASFDAKGEQLRGSTSAGSEASRGAAGAYTQREEGAKKATPADDYLREQRERREAAAKQEEIDRKIRVLRTAEIPATLGAEELAELLEQCRQEQAALEHRDETMRRIATPALSDAPPSGASDASGRSSGRGSNPGSAKPSRKTPEKLADGEKRISQETRSAGRMGSDGAAAAAQAGVAAESARAVSIGDGLTEARLADTNKPVSSIVGLPPAKGAAVVHDTKRVERRPKSADALLTLPAL
ncbi:hypothetical protein KFL_000020260 [Klebsormidium nitens]|uniref:Fibrous sheath-interacting protein 1 n=1 Tax=Klebsormidium nitens TaxID=105231 RepID=A0A1Y1HGX1_KLENI|nr:hypothetical protein KFL_000020260 [Klebsormidium nitens]|eukprot:GAQ77664.1 hypothetical protein KFL_000020260 [Klebsormidium nitens]